jgi:integrase
VVDRRQPWRQLDYDAIRAVLRRANSKLSTNWSLYDLRHTFAIRTANDPKVPLVSLQVLLGHAHLASTQRYLKPHLEQVIAHARDHHLRPRQHASPGPSVLGYDNADLDELFGWQ